MDPLTSLGITANVAQFIQFTGALLEQSWALYEGRPSSNFDLELVVRDMNQIASQIAAASKPRKSQRVSQEKKGLQKLCERCIHLSGQMLAVLDSLHVDNPGQRWESFCKAMRSMRKRNQLEEMQKTVNNIRAGMHTHMLLSLGNQQSEIVIALEKLNSELMRMGITNTQFQQKLLELKQGEDTSPRSWQNATDPSKVQVATNIVQVSQDTRASLIILYNLQFHSIKLRQSNIPNAHKNTFSWVFQQNLGAWLRSGEGIFWVSGKPGSGKSTLCKFLPDDPRTRFILQNWAGQKELFVSSYFFWKAGTNLQKSISGLLRTILYDILRVCPRLTPEIFPDRWQKTQIQGVDNDSWTQTELLDALKRLLSTKLSARFCIFIDGLDEYVGDHQEIIRLLKDIIFYEKNTSSDIKICLSSRPWNIFEDAFGQDPSGMLRMEDLTRGDILLYVSENLKSNPRYSELEKEEEHHNLVQEVTDRANGVFLWVYMVVKELLAGLTNYDPLSILMVRLQKLPTDLEQFFLHILDSIEEVYHESSAQILQLCIHAKEPLHILGLTLLEDSRTHLGENVQSGFWNCIDLEAWSIQKRFMKYKTMIKQLNARCGGLVEIEGRGEHLNDWLKVEFLHRTVQEFLDTQEIQVILRKRAGQEFSANTVILKLIMKEMVAIGYIPTFEKIFYDSQVLSWVVNYAYYTQKAFDEDHTDIWPAFDFMTTQVANFIKLLVRHSASEPKGKQLGENHGLVQNLREIALQNDMFPLLEYLSTLSHGFEDVDMRNGLGFIIALETSTYACPKLPRAIVINFVLSNGGDPNRQLDFSDGLIQLSAWGMILLRVVKEWESWSEPTKKEIRESCRVFLQHGVSLAHEVCVGLRVIKAKQILVEIVGLQEADLRPSLSWKPRKRQGRIAQKFSSWKKGFKSRKTT